MPGLLFYRAIFLSSLSLSWSTCALCARVLASLRRVATAACGCPVLCGVSEKQSAFVCLFVLVCVCIDAFCARLKTRAGALWRAHLEFFFIWPRSLVFQVLNASSVLYRCVCLCMCASILIFKRLCVCVASSVLVFLLLLIITDISRCKRQHCLPFLSLPIPLPPCYGCCCIIAGTLSPFLHMARARTEHNNSSRLEFVRATCD